MRPADSRWIILPLALVILSLGIWIYWPGIASPWMLDDRSNLAVVGHLGEGFGGAADYVFGNRSGPLGRPVSMASFVLEELYLDAGVSGSKRVNIVLHAVNGALVMWLLSLLLAHARVPRHRWFALLGGAAWLLAPLYVSTVLYVVQRMAMLSTLFMLLSCIVYCYWRSRLFRGVAGWGLFGALLCSVAAAVLSKENGVLVVPVLVLLEVLWFGARDSAGTRNPLLRRVSLSLLSAGAVVALLLFALFFDRIKAGYARRGFDLDERVMTQARALWDYLAQLVWPDLPRMGLFHDDYPVSTSLQAPPETAYAVAAWLLLIPLGLLLLRSRPGQLLVCAVLIFLVGHAIESSVFALELYFEHRNYFPGVGVFLLLVTALGLLSRRWPPLAAPLLAWLAVYVLVLAVQTGSQVQLWSSAPLLRLNYVNHHPESFRANEEMALHLAAVGALDSALDYSRRAAQLSATERVGDWQIRDLALHCLAGRDIPPARFAELATVNAQRPFAVVSTFNGFTKVLQSGRCSPTDTAAFADRMAEVFLAQEDAATASANFYSILAGLANSLEQYARAHAYMQKFLALSPGSVRGLLMQLHFSTALGLEQERQNLMAQLGELEAAGKLDAGERQTLALYR
ncbi:MAG: hypothetical protein KDI09_14570 [Halioglobus sp.]|nr:hypothetical protein [Halioglobus sp.]